MTGMTFLAFDLVVGKRLELLKPSGVGGRGEMSGSWRTDRSI